MLQPFIDKSYIYIYIYIPCLTTVHVLVLLFCFTYFLVHDISSVEVLNLHALAPKAAYKDADGVNPTRQADTNQKKLVIQNLNSQLARLDHSHLSQLFYLHFCFVP